MYQKISFWISSKNPSQDYAVKYLDADGKTRTKLLIGKSEKFQVFWHLGVSAQPLLGQMHRFSLKTHVIFTIDGKTPIDSKNRMHALRRGFCRRWWNERWRGLLLAYLKYLSNDNGEIIIKVSPTQSLVVNGLPLKVNSPFSVMEKEMDTSNISDENLDDISDEIELNEDTDTEAISFDDTNVDIEENED